MSIAGLARAALAFVSITFVAQLWAAEPQSASRTVTLITGDRVTVVEPHGALSIQAAKGRERIRFATHTQLSRDGKTPHRYVIPEDATPLISAGKLDEQLFDVTELLDSRFDDASRDYLPIILTYCRQSPARRLSSSELAAVGGAISGELTSVNGAAVHAAKKQSSKLWKSLRASAVEKVWLDRVYKPTSIPSTGVHSAAAKMAATPSYTGQGVVVAVIDSGVDLTHPDLAGRILDTHNFTLEVDEDVTGHGTHIASIIAGSGAASNGLYRGVAPDAQLVIAKVCESWGCLSSSILQGLQWSVIDKHAKIVNIGVVVGDAPGISALEDAVNQLSAQYGALVVVAAGDSIGGLPVGDPATADAALSVGAVDAGRQIASFSRRGPRKGDKGIKPDITAPGVNVVGALAANTSPAGTPVGDFYVSMSGTSAAAAYVTGAAAILSQRFPTYTGAKLKNILMGTALPHPTASAFEQGAGQVDIAAALDVRVSSNRSNLSFGTAQWPHDDDLPIMLSATYTNESTQPISASFLFEVSDPNGNAVPPGMFTVSPGSLNVPVGTAMTVIIRIDTNLNGPDGFYSGRLVAIDPNSSARPMIHSLPIAVEREGEAYYLTLSHRDRQGLLATAFETHVVPAEDSKLPFTDLYTAMGDVILRLPRGRYAINSTISTLSDASRTILVQPVLDLTATTRVDLDARVVQPVIFNGPGPQAIQGLTAIQWFNPAPYNYPTPWVYSEIAYEHSSTKFYTAQLGAPSPGLKFYAQGYWSNIRTDADGTTHPELYAAAWPQNDVFPTGFTATVQPATMALVNARYAAARPDINRGQMHASTGLDRNFTIYGGSPPQLVPLPYERTEYYSVGPNIPWGVHFDLYLPDNNWFGGLDSPFAPFSATGPYTRRFNEPIYAVSSNSSNRFAGRSENTLSLYTPIYGDKAGNSAQVMGSFHSALYRNGVLLTEAPDIFLSRLVPPESSTYRFEVSGAQSLAEFSRQVNVAWTFESSYADPFGIVLPLLTAQLKPALNAQGEAAAGSIMRMPISVRQDGTSVPVSVKSLTVDVSFDDGATWNTATVNHVGDKWLAVFQHPAQGQYVSLRTSVSDYSGNQFEETVVRAYAMGNP